jgi:hypothetical protein
MATRKERDYISPSDLTFLWGECKQCFWMKYNKGLTRPGFMPLVGPMSAFQEKSYRDKSTTVIDSRLGKGTVTDWGNSVESVPLKVNGKDSRWKIKGKYDVVATLADNSVALIDCKVTTSEMASDKVDLYWPQLEAYAYALENPANGDGVRVSETGLLMWRIVGADTNHLSTFNFECEKGYLSAGRQPERFDRFIAEVIELLDGAMPESDESCPICKYVAKREAL